MIREYTQARLEMHLLYQKLLAGVIKPKEHHAAMKRLFEGRWKEAARLADEVLRKYGTPVASLGSVERFLPLFGPRAAWAGSRRSMPKLPDIANEIKNEMGATLDPNYMPSDNLPPQQYTEAWVQFTNVFKLNPEQDWSVKHILVGGATAAAGLVVIGGAVVGAVGVTTVGGALAVTAVVIGGATSVWAGGSEVLAGTGGLLLNEYGGKYLNMSPEKIKQELAKTDKLLKVVSGVDTVANVPGLILGAGGPGATLPDLLGLLSTNNSAETAFGGLLKDVLKDILRDPKSGLTPTEQEQLKQTLTELEHQVQPPSPTGTTGQAAPPTGMSAEAEKLYQEWQKATQEYEQEKQRVEDKWGKTTERRDLELFKQKEELDKKVLDPLKQVLSEKQKNYEQLALASSKAHDEWMKLQPEASQLKQEVGKLQRESDALNTKIESLQSQQAREESNIQRYSELLKEDPSRTDARNAMETSERLLTEIGYELEAAQQELRNVQQELQKAQQELQKAQLAVDNARQAMSAVNSDAARKEYEEAQANLEAARKELEQEKEKLEAASKADSEAEKADRAALEEKRLAAEKARQDYVDATSAPWQAPIQASQSAQDAAQRAAEQGAAAGAQAAQQASQVSPPPPPPPTVPHHH
jgi:hypothetical protein